MKTLIFMARQLPSPYCTQRQWHLGSKSAINCINRILQSKEVDTTADGDELNYAIEIQQIMAKASAAFGRSRQHL